MERIILHCDLNAFYASVELLDRPDLRGRAVAVCGDPASRHGVVLAKNDRAKAAGVQTGEPIGQARRKCPGLVCLPPHHRLYREYSRKVNEIYLRYTDLVEPFGIDESWLDLTGSIHLFGGDAVEVGNRIRAEVKEKLRLTVSVGVSFNKVFAKLGSDYRKPDATTRVGPDNWKELVWPMTVDNLLFVGRAARSLLARCGIRTIGQLAAADPAVLEELLGKQGRTLYRYANGRDREPVRPWHQPEPVKSVGNGSTFPRNLTTVEQVRQGTAVLCDSVAARLRRQGLYCGALQVAIRDPQFKTVSRQKLLPRSTHLMRELTAAAMELIQEIWKPPSPIRLITVTATHLTEEAETYCQLDLLAEGEDPRQEKLETVMDTIRDRFGKDAIGYGAARRGGKNG